MRNALLIAVVVLAACPQQQKQTQPQPPGETAAPAAQPRELRTIDAGSTAAPEAAPAPAEPDPALEGPLEKFAGFSADESRYAFSIYSEGAGFYLLNVVEGSTGKIAERFQLSDEENQSKARAYLKTNGYSTRTRPPSEPPASRAKAAVTNGKVEVTLAPEGGGAPKVLYSGDPFNAEDGMGAPSNAAIAGSSPAGKKLLVKVEQTPVTEFGGITTYLVLDVEAEK